ncbi:MAG: hypothetical protein ACKVX7_04910 [Planctomycetota bacterium]
MLSPKFSSALLAACVAVAIGAHARSLTAERVELARKLEQRTRVLTALELAVRSDAMRSTAPVAGRADVPAPHPAAVVAPPPAAPVVRESVVEPLVVSESASTAPMLFELPIEAPTAPTAHGSLRGPTGDRVLLEYRGARRWLAEGATLKGWQVVHVGRRAVILENAARGARSPRVVHEVYSHE